MRRKTHQEFIKDIRNRNPNINIIGEYINGITKLDVECNICKYRWCVIPNNLLRSTGCPKCNVIKMREKLRKSHNEFVENMKNINQDIEIISEYKGDREKVECLCKIDNCKWFAIPSNLLRGHGCPNCAKVKKSKLLKYSHEAFITKITDSI